MDGLRYNDSIRKVEIYEKCFLSVVGHCCIMVCHGLWRNEMYSNASFLVVPESPIKCYQWPLWARKLHFRKSGPEKSAKKVLESYPSIFPLRQFIAGAYLCCHIAKAGVHLGQYIAGLFQEMPRSIHVLHYSTSKK